MTPKKITTTNNDSSSATPSWDVMGIVNVTPDSFYDGGRFNSSVDLAIDHCAKLVSEGATILDIGGESTRPGAEKVSLSEELQRVIPVVEAVKSRFKVRISIDTTKSDVAEAAIGGGAGIVNDISSGRFDESMPSCVARHNVQVVLMHSRKTPEDMQVAPLYDDVTSEVLQELQKSIALFENAGVASSKIVVDPGIGFAKRLEDNVALLHNADRLRALGYPVLVGTSRKSFIGAITQKDSSDRLAGSLATVGESYRRGATLFRVHDVAETVDYLKVVDAVNGVL